MREVSASSGLAVGLGTQAPRGGSPRGGEGVGVVARLAERTAGVLPEVAIAEDAPRDAAEDAFVRAVPVTPWPYTLAAPPVTPKTPDAWSTAAMAAAAYERAPHAPGESLLCRKLRVVMCRHGQTPANFRKLTQGQSDSGLTMQGVKQAELLGARLADYRFDHVYCSDLGRAVKTLEAASHVSAACGNPLPGPTYTTQLRERHAGPFEGKVYGSADRAARASGVGPRSFRPKGGESWEDVRARARIFLYELVGNHLAPSEREPVVLCMTHGGFIKEFINAAGELASAETKEMWQQVRGRPSPPLYPNKARNCGIYVFEVSPAYPGGLRVAPVLENDVAHLTAAYTQAAKELHVPTSPLRLTAPLP